ncbi:MAG TPA: hypothetical protein VLE89_05020 [Chlamydiales bacterium]|nr:hypothetical protein [Chlamydiales bacterium]
MGNIGEGNFIFPFLDLMINTVRPGQNLDKQTILDAYTQMIEGAFPNDSLERQVACASQASLFDEITKLYDQRVNYAPNPPLQYDASLPKSPKVGLVSEQQVVDQLVNASSKELRESNPIPLFARAFSAPERSLWKRDYIQLIYQRLVQKTLEQLFPDTQDPLREIYEDLTPFVFEVFEKAENHRVALSKRLPRPDNRCCDCIIS